MSGWIKAHRQLRDSPMLQSAVRKGVWLDLLLMAAHQPTRISLRGRAVDLEPGQCAIVMRDWAKTLGLTPRQLERIMDSFVSENGVSRSAGPGKAYTLVTITKYREFQSLHEARGERAVEAAGKGRGKGGEREQEPKESKNQDIPPNGGGQGDGKYRWEGDVIRLNEKDFDRWESSFGAIDLASQLASLDAYLASPDAGDNERKRWFPFVAGALKNRNEDARSRERYAAKRDSDRAPMPGEWQ